MNQKRDIIIQSILSSGIAFLLTILFVSYDFSEQGKTYVGFSANDSIVYLFYFIGATVISLISGLFIRLNKNTKQWFRKNYWMSIVIIVTGIFFCILSIQDENIILLKYRMDGMDFQYWQPKPTLTVSGWFFTIFGSQHLFLPLKKK